MNQTRSVSWTCGSWIDEEELPVMAGLKVIRTNDPDHGLTEAEINDRNEFIRCYILQELDALLMIPSQVGEDDFFAPYFDETGCSAFQSVDFQRRLRPFNKLAYAMKKILERVEHLAILHSCISSEQGRLNTYRRYQGLVRCEFEDRLMSFRRQFKAKVTEERKSELKRKIADVNRRIMECKRIWERYAPSANWDH